METDYYMELQAERKKLENLVDEALKNGTPINKTHLIMEQCKKVNQLILKIKGRKY